MGLACQPVSGPCPACLDCMLRQCYAARLERGARCCQECTECNLGLQCPCVHDPLLPQCHSRVSARTRRAARQSVPGGVQAGAAGKAPASAASAARQSAAPVPTMQDMFAKLPLLESLVMATGAVYTTTRQMMANRNSRQALVELLSSCQGYAAKASHSHGQRCGGSHSQATRELQAAIEVHAWLRAVCLSCVCVYPAKAHDMQ
jgi:hypothetical protein